MTNFNSEQLKAINFHEGACGVVAGSGSGKSTVLLNRIDNLVKAYKVPQHDILAISFTNKTATELKQKLKGMKLENVNVGTFHAITSSILLQEDINVHGKLIADWQIENLFTKMGGLVELDDIKSFIGYQKNHNKSYKDPFVYKESIYTDEELRVYFKVYEEFKTKNGLYDFDDYLIMCLDILQQNKGKYAYDFILVDEHQDSNLVQHRILKELCQSGNMFCLFDYRQAIFGFRGGDVEYCMNFDKYWNNPTIINLHTNYRSTKNIVNNANKFIKPYFKNYAHYVDSQAHNDSDGEITLRTYMSREVEAVEVVDKIEELIKQGEKLNEIAVLYRLNSHSNHIENELKLRGIEYDITNDSSFFKRTEIKGIIGMLRLLNNPHDDNAFETVFKLRCYPFKFMSNKLLEDAKRYSGLNDMSLYEAFISMRYTKPFQTKAARDFETVYNRLRLQVDKETNVVTIIGNIVKSLQIESFIYDKYKSKEEMDERLESIGTLKSFVKQNNLEQFINYVHTNTAKKKSKKDAVKLMSVHSSKGLEWANCFLVGVEHDRFPHVKSQEEEEARLWYVAVTRSKLNLHISEIIGESGIRSPFIEEYFGK